MTRARVERSRMPQFVLRLAASVGIAFVVALLVAGGLGTGSLEGIRARTSDALVFPRGSAAPSVVVVAVDARSVAALQQAWPWTRDVQADLVMKISDAGARVVVLDVVLAPATASDDRLVAALRAAPSVIGAAVEAAGERDRQWSREGVLIAQNVITPEPRFSEVAAVAHTAVTPDGDDGVARQLPLVVEADRRFLPALALAAIAAHDDASPQVTVRRDGVQVGTRTIPTDARHRLRISYTEDLTGSEDAAVVSAVDVLNGSARVNLRNKVVFVGVTDPGAGDRLLTPVAKRSGMAGVLVHANAFNTITTRTYLAEASTSLIVAWAFALALLVAMATLLVRSLIGVLTAILVSVGYLLVCVASANGGSILDALFPVLGVVVALLAAAGVREFLVDRRRRRIATLFSQYVPPRVARELVGDARTSGLLDGQRLHATVLFCDIRGFTPLTAALGPTQIRALLNEYYTVLSEVVLAHGGAVLRYTGDEILAAFGAPIASDDHARDAVRGATAMHAAQPDLGERLTRAGLPTLNYGIGVQSGEVVSAIMGSDIRRQYAVIGTALTLGSRLCSQAGAGETVVSSETWALIGANAPPAEQFTAALKGREEPAVLYRIRDPRLSSTR